MKPFSIYNNYPLAPKSIADKQIIKNRASVLRVSTCIPYIAYAWDQTEQYLMPDSSSDLTNAVKLDDLAGAKILFSSFSQTTTEVFEPERDIKVNAHQQNRTVAIFCELHHKNIYELDKMGIVWSAFRRFISRKDARSSRKEHTRNLVKNGSPATSNYGSITETANEETNDSSSQDYMKDNAKEDRSALPDSTSAPVMGILNQYHIQSTKTADTGSINEVNATNSSMTSQGISIQGNSEGVTVGPIKIAGDKNYIVINEPKPTIDPTPLTKPVEFGIRENIPDFIGREKFIETLHHCLKPKDSDTPSIRSRTVLICGMPGVGKTQLVRKYIQQYKKSYFHLLWINAEKHFETKGRLLKLAEGLPIDIYKHGKQSEEMDNQDILDKIFDYACQKPALIVFDNVESYKTDGDKQGLRCLLPGNIKAGWKSPSIIVTTRNRDWKDYFEQIELPVFEAEESLELLSKKGLKDSEDNQDSIKKIRRMCQDLPIGLQQVISFFQYKQQIHASLSKVPYTLNEFLAEVMCSKTELLSAKPEEQLEFFKLLEKTFEHIATMEHGPMALRCLQIMAPLNPDKIPKEVFMSYFDNDKNLGKALDLLHRLNLATRCKEFYQIHRMFQAAAMKSEFIKNLSKQNRFEELADFFSKLLKGMRTFTREVKLALLESAVRLNNQLPQVNHALSEICREVTATVHRYPQQVPTSTETTTQPFNVIENHIHTRLYSDVTRSANN
ncbi:unnamed protein product [Allacma fusca]|uniref:AAA+ ATPase domain-containing protein n=1 Tax=Allacma fusca TaxID=39272 RepID=A0A8J2KXR3_9HEXA|nr:unnamed protein product [Allacma fusca]